MTYNFLTFESVNSIGVLTLSHARKLNALSTKVLSELKHFFSHIEQLELRGLIFTGAGDKAFIAGADVSAMDSMKGEQGRELGQLGQKVASLIENAPLPVIACVNGYALGGGCELALACDFIYASENARFGQPEVKLGLIPGFGGCVRLSRRIGPAVAKELIFTGRMVSANEGHQLGLVNKVFTDKKALIEAAKHTLQEVSRQSPYAVSVAKRVLNDIEGFQSTDPYLIESQGYYDVFEHPDKNEGVSAFLEKRPANF